MATNDDLRSAWHRFCDDLKGAVDHVVDPNREVDDDERAEGIRHVLRMLSMQVEQIFENDDPLHPELGWRYPLEDGPGQSRRPVSDRPDGLAQHLSPVGERWQRSLARVLDHDVDLWHSTDPPADRTRRTRPRGRRRRQLRGLLLTQPRSTRCRRRHLASTRTTRNPLAAAAVLRRLDERSPR